MKINKYILLLSATMVVVSCDLDKFPEGSTVTQDQKNEVVENRSLFSYKPVD